MSFNTDKLVYGEQYDYVTRTSFNQGILQTTGFVNESNINEAGIWSLGLLQMDFFYRKKKWYAGQFVRKIIPKFEIPTNSIQFFTTVLNGLKKKLLSVLIRNVDKTFCDSIIYLPVKNGKIDFEFIENFVAELEIQRVIELEAYFNVTGLKNYELTEEENNILRDYNNIEFKSYNILDLFTVKNTKNILSRDITPNSGKTPYLCASSENNSISSYINYKKELIDEGNCIFIGGKTFVVTYQENNFYSNDSHNLTLYMKNKEYKNKYVQLYLTTCIKKSLGHKYSWGNSVSKSKIKDDNISLPIMNYNKMKTFISAIQKLVIKDVVKYTDMKIEATKKVINN